KLTGLEARPVVHAEDGFHRKEIEQPVLNHLARAAPALLGGLKDEVHGAVEVALAREIVRSGEQHRGVPVMPAGVHLPSMNARVSEAVPLGHGQRVDVSAQTHGPRGAPVPHDADDPSPAEAPMHGDAPARERAGDEIGGPLLLEAELGMCVKVPPQRLDCRGLGGGRYRFFAKSVAAVRIRMAAGTMAVSAPAPPTTPRNQGGKLRRTTVNNARSPLARPGTRRTVAKPAKKMKASVSV